MTRFMKLFLFFAAVSCHSGLAQELQVSYTTELQSDFKQGSNWVNLLETGFHSVIRQTHDITSRHHQYSQNPHRITG